MGGRSVVVVRVGRIRLGGMYTVYATSQPVFPALFFFSVLEHNEVVLCYILCFRLRCTYCTVAGLSAAGDEKDKKRERKMFLCKVSRRDSFRCTGTSPTRDEATSVLQIAWDTFSICLTLLCGAGGRVGLCCLFLGFGNVA